jgi:hypothetical protein
MPRLPHLDRAIVPEAKILNYRLNAYHSGGRAKARFLESFVFRAQDWRALRDAIIAHARRTMSLHPTKPASAPDTRSMGDC